LGARRICLRKLYPDRVASVTKTMEVDREKGCEKMNHLGNVLYLQDVGNQKKRKKKKTPRHAGKATGVGVNWQNGLQGVTH